MLNRVLLLITGVRGLNLYCADEECTTCSYGLVFKNLSCLDLCPHGFDKTDSLYCRPNYNSLLIYLDFSQNLDFSTSRIGDFKHPEDLPFNDPHRGSPIPSRKQGFYFTSTSRLISTRSWVLSPIFTLQLMFRPSEDGTLFEVLSPSDTSLKLSINSGQLIFEIMLFSASTTSINVFADTFTYSTWNINKIVVTQMKDNINIQINSIPVSLADSEFREQISLMNFYFGSNSGSFSGFIYFFTFDNSESAFTFRHGGLENCNYNEYYQQSSYSCVSCDNNCNSWPWCVRGGDCSPCFLTRCSNCTGLGYNGCISCSSGYSAPGCEPGIYCNEGSGFMCSSCQGSFAKIDEHCLFPPYPYNDTDLSTPVIDIKFTDFQEFYGGLFQSGDDFDSYAPFSNPSSEDPIPLRNRGLYMSGSYLKSNKDLSMNYKFTFDYWCKSFDDTIRVLWYSEYIHFMNVGYMNISLTSFEESKFFSTSLVYSDIKWQFYRFIVDFEGDVTMIKQFHNKEGLRTVFSLEGYMLYDRPNAVLVGAGGGYEKFYGYVYLIRLWQMPVYNYEPDYKTCPYSLEIFCLWEATLNHYYNYYKQKTSACDNTCESCATWGTCNQCLYPGCSVCDSYSSICSEDIPMPCLSGFHYTRSRVCCSYECSDCFGPDDYSCLSCENNKSLLGSICVNLCPTSMLSENGVCVHAVDGVVSVTFNEISNKVVDSLNGIIFYAGMNSEFHPNPDTNDPLPAFKRGYYFSTISYMTSDDFIISYNCTIGFILKYLQPGVLFTKNGLKIEIGLSSTSLTLDINQIYTFGALPTGTWLLLIFNFYSNIESVLHVGFGYSATSFQLLSRSQSFILNDTLSASVIGSSANSFTGFIWSFHIKNSYVLFTDYTVATCASDLETNCLWPCELNQYLSGTYCIQCDNYCTSGCRRQKDCNLCVDSECIKCDSYNNPCTRCGENSYKVGNTCSCNSGYFKRYDDTCESCPKKTLESICIDMCPIGYSAFSANCTLLKADGLVFHLAFTEITGIYLDSISNIPVLTGKTEQYYPNIEDSDPIPSYLRGVYFTGNGSYLSFPSNSESTLLFALRAFFSLWINPVNSTGVLLTNLNHTNAELLTISLINYRLKLKLLISGQYHSSQSTQQLNPQVWSHILISIDYNSFTTGSITINAIASQISTFSSQPFIHNNTSQVYIGKSISNEFFTGFIYLIEIYVQPPLVSKLFSTNSSYCNYALPTNKCIPNCNITTFYSIATLNCSNCSVECNKGCRNAESCSVCSDKNCAQCSRFSDSSCIKCSEPYELVNSECIACKDNAYYNKDTLSCKACEGLCNTCIGFNNCLSCVINSSMISQGLCECNLGFNISENMCIRVLFSAFLNIKNDNKVLLVFSEPLANNLTTNNIEIFVNNDSFLFTILQIDNYSYSLEMDLLETSGTLQVNFTNEITSVNNSLLTTKYLQAQLFENPESKLASAVKLMKESAKVMFKASFGAVAGSSFISFDPSSMFTFLNSAELVYLTILYNIDMEEDLIQLLKSIQLNSIVPFPSVFQKFENFNSTLDLPKNYEDFGYYTNIIMINSEWFLNLLIIIVLVHSIALGAQYFSCKRIQTPWKIFVSYFRYKIYLRYWIQTFMELTFNSIIGIYFFKYESSAQIFNFVFCFFILTVQCLTFVGMIIVFKKRKKLKDFNKIESFLTKFGAFFEEFKQENSSQMLFYIFFIARRALLCAIIHFVQLGFLQLIFSIVFSFSVIVYVISTKCYLNFINAIYFVTLEITVLLYYILILVGLNSGAISKSQTISYAVGLIGMLICLTMLVSVIKLVLRIRILLAKWRKPKTVSISINHEKQDAIEFNYLKKSTDMAFNMMHPRINVCAADQSSDMLENPIQNSIADQSYISGR